MATTAETDATTAAEPTEGYSTAPEAALPPAAAPQRAACAASDVGRGNLGFPPDADGNGNYAFFDAANYALIQMTGGVTAISAV